MKAMTKRAATKKQNEILKLFFTSGKRGRAQVMKTTYKADFSEMKFQIQELFRREAKDFFSDIGPARTFEEMKQYLTA